MKLCYIKRKMILARFFILCDNRKSSVYNCNWACNYGHRLLWWLSRSQCDSIQFCNFFCSVHSIGFFWHKLEVKARNWQKNPTRNCCHIVGKIIRNFEFSLWLDFKVFYTSILPHHSFVIVLSCLRLGWHHSLFKLQYKCPCNTLVHEGLEQDVWPRRSDQEI